MAKNQQFLLIDGVSDQIWYQLLKETLSSLGKLLTGNEKQAVSMVQEGDYELVILDALAVRNVPRLVSRLRSQRPDVRIVVATASPTWRRARETLLAGATDYIPKSYDKEALFCTLSVALEKKPPPWPR
ncbi:MAG: response regulator [Candidatus Promineifilaceae bacterium]